jgi:hypothetical protein
LFDRLVKIYQVGDINDVIYFTSELNDSGRNRFMFLCKYVKQLEILLLAWICKNGGNWKVIVLCNRMNLTALNQSLVSI